MIQRKGFRTFFLILSLLALMIGFSACPSPTGGSDSSDEITVRFDSHGGNAVSPMTFDGSGVPKRPEAPTREGYEFKGWYTDGEYNKAWDFSTKASSSITLHARWQAEKRTVKFNTSGENVNVEDVETTYDAKLSKPDVKKEGKYVEGWYKDEDCTEEWDFSQDVVKTQGMTLYAKWKNLGADEVVVFFDTQGGNYAVEQVIVKNKSLEEPEEKPVKEGFTFEGWYEAPDGYQKWDFTDPVSVSMTLYAHWEADVHHDITFEAHNKSTSQTQRVVHGGFLEHVTAPVKENSIFKGWYITESGTEADKWDFEQDTVISDMTLHARWEAIPTNQKGIIFDSRGGTAVPSSFVDEGGKITEPADPEKTGYIFKGWYKTKNGTEAWDFDQDTVSSDMTLYAQWDETDQTAVDLVKDGIHRNSQGQITSRLSVNFHMKEGIQIEWFLDEEPVLTSTPENGLGHRSHDFTIVRPASSRGKQLKAVITKGETHTEKILAFTVYGTDNQAVDSVYNDEAMENNKTFFIDGDNTEMPLSPKSIEGTSVTWASSDNNVAQIGDSMVTVNGGQVEGSKAVFTRPADSNRDVTLTATISKGEVSRTKDFIITVYKEGYSASSQDFLNTISVTAEPEANIILTTGFVGSEKTVEWTSSDSGLIEIKDLEENKGDEQHRKTACIKPRFYEDQTATLTAAIDGETKEFPVTLKGVKDVYDVEIDASTIKVDGEEWYEQDQYSYDNHDVTERTFVVRQTHASYPGGRLVPIAQAIQKQADVYEARELLRIDGLKELSTMDAIDINDVKQELIIPVHSFAGRPIPEDGEETFWKMREFLNMWDYPATENLDYQDFQDLSSDEKTNTVKDLLEENRKDIAESCKLGENATWDELKAALPALFQELEDEALQKAGEEKSYSYKIFYRSHEPNSLEIMVEREYVNGKAWNEQDGSWYWSGDNYEYLDLYKHKNGNRGGLSCNLSNNYSYYRGTFNEDFTSFTGRYGDEQITVPIEDKGDGTIVLTLSGVDYTLHFEGADLMHD